MSQFLLFHIFVGENLNFMTHAGLSLNLLATVVVIHLCSFSEPCAPQNPAMADVWWCLHIRVLRADVQNVEVSDHLYGPLIHWVIHCTSEIKPLTTILNSRLFTILITRYVLCWTSGGTRINWPIDCGPYCLVGHSPLGHRLFLRRGEGTSRTGDSELVGNVAPSNTGFDQRLFDRMNQNEEIKGSGFELFDCSTFCNWNAQHLDIKKDRKRPAFLQENFLWYVKLCE